MLLVKNTIFSSLHFSFIAFHSICFSTASLSICKNGGMVPFDHLVYQIWNAKTLIDILLTVVLVEHLIEIV